MRRIFTALQLQRVEYRMSGDASALRVYAHAMKEEETDLSFLDFGGTKRHPGGTHSVNASNRTKPPRVTPRRGLANMEHETRFELATGRIYPFFEWADAPTRHSLIARGSPSRWQIIPGIAQTYVVAHFLWILGPVLLGA
jgi:hypothetical protein